MHAWSRAQHAEGRRIGCVPTMGALHAGHMALIEEARRRSDIVVVSIFVNPLQFNRDDDFDKYPRPIDDDVDACRAAGVDAVYAPTAAVMYPDGLSDPRRARRAGRFAGRVEPARTLPRGCHRRRQAVRRDPARRRRVRPEGLPTAGDHSPDGRRPRHGRRDRGGADRQRARRSGDLQPQLAPQRRRPASGGVRRAGAASRICGLGRRRA